MVEPIILGALAGAVYKLSRQGTLRWPRRLPSELPPLDVLRAAPGRSDGRTEALADRLCQRLAGHGVTVELLDIVTGPTVTRIELELDQGVRVSKLTSLRSDIAYAIGHPDPRILTTVNGRSVIGIEYPRPDRETVRLRTVLGDSRPRPLEIALGLDTDGTPVTVNVGDLPHLLIAGATGAGKSTFLNSLIVSLLMGASPRDMRLLLIDPKQVELTPYERLPHLWRPVVTDTAYALKSLSAVIDEMRIRYRKFRVAKVRNIGEARAKGLKMPYLVIVIDELANLTSAAGAVVETLISTIAAEGRAAGIHTVLATQRPSVDVVRGRIKANVPARVAFAVASNTDSRVILDVPGAETLTGRGDLLFSDGGRSLVRAQGALVTDDEIRKVVAHWISR